MPQSQCLNQCPTIIPYTVPGTRDMGTWDMGHGQMGGALVLLGKSHVPNHLKSQIPSRRLQGPIFLTGTITTTDPHLLHWIVLAHTYESIETRPPSISLKYHQSRRLLPLVKFRLSACNRHCRRLQVIVRANPRSRSRPSARGENKTKIEAEGQGSRLEARGSRSRSSRSRSRSRSRSKSKSLVWEKKTCTSFPTSLPLWSPASSPTDTWLMHFIPPSSSQTYLSHLLLYTPRSTLHTLTTSSAHVGTRPCNPFLTSTCRPIPSAHHQTHHDVAIDLVNGAVLHISVQFGMQDTGIGYFQYG